MQVGILAFGTRGDVQPMLAFGQGLHQRGHRVRMLASSHFDEWIEQHGLESWPSTVDIQAIMSSPKGIEWVEAGSNPRRGSQMMKELLHVHGEQMAQDIWQASSDCDVLVGGFTTFFAAASVAEKRGIPLLSALLQPPILPTMYGATMVSTLQPEAISLTNKLFGYLLLEPVLWSMVKPVVQQLRRKLELRPWSLATYRQAMRATPTLLGYSRHVSPRAPDWPEHVVSTGFWYFDEPYSPPAELEHFLQAGPPPICIGFGSMPTRDPRQWGELLRKAVQLSGERAIILGGWSGLEDTSSEDILMLPAASHTWLFPRSKLVVHHGGAGTSAAVLRAGVPQIVVPHFTDQPYWAQRLAFIGVAPHPILRQDLSATNLAAAIKITVEDRTMQARAKQLKALIDQEHGLQQALAYFERWIA